jgi:hypothetical protein
VSEQCLTAGDCGVRSGASLSLCGRYRFDLTREWGCRPVKPDRRVAFVMLNPSTADGHADDPTIRRCMGFAREWGFDGLVVVNLFAMRATRPDDVVKVLRAGGDAVGPDNGMTKDGSPRHPLYVPAWQQPVAFFPRGKVSAP